jgi:hypothetical protein
LHLRSGPRARDRLESLQPIAHFDDLIVAKFGKPSPYCWFFERLAAALAQAQHQRFDGRLRRTIFWGVDFIPDHFERDVVRQIEQATAADNVGRFSFLDLLSVSLAAKIAKTRIGARISPTGRAHRRQHEDSRDDDAAATRFTMATCNSNMWRQLVPWMRQNSRQPSGPMPVDKVVISDCLRDAAEMLYHFRQSNCQVFQPRRV